jgi:hypothetical protein
MSTANNLTSLNGLFKEVYADKIEHLIPEGVKVYNLIKFAQRNKQPGNFYNQPVVLGLEHGVTFAAEDEGAFALNPAITGQVKNAQVRGFQMLLRSVMAYDAAYASLGGGAKAFEDGTKFLVANMMKSIVRKVEIALIYGQIGYGAVASTAANVITITTAEWAPGIWAGSEKMKLEIYSSAGTLRGDCSVTAVDMDLRTVTVDSLPAGVVATDVIYHYGAFQKEMPGIHKIISNTSSLFGISAATYSLWKGNSYSAAGALSFTKLSTALARSVEKGLESSVICLVNPRTWSTLMTDMAANRRFDSSYKSSVGSQGNEVIEFFSQNGKIEIHSSIYVKEGYSYLIAPEDFLRIGSTDITFKQPGKSDEFFRELENNAGFELRCYSNQSLFCKAPGKQTLISGIVN